MHHNTHSSGKQPPQAAELEEAVLGALLIESNAIHQIEGIITQDDFYHPAHQAIFMAISNLSAQNKPVDMLTAVEELRRMGQLGTCGGAYRIAQLTEKVASAAHICYHARIIAQKALARRIITQAGTIQDMAYDDTRDIGETLEYFGQALTNVQPENIAAQAITMSQALKAAIDEASHLQSMRTQGISNDIPTPLTMLNQALNGGFRRPDLIIIGARPSMGKTQVALQIAKTAAQAGKHTAFISIEMTAVQLTNRYLLEAPDIRTTDLLSGQMDTRQWEALDRQASYLYNLPLHFADHHSIRYLANIKTEARRLKRLGQLDMLIIDYLGLIRTNLRFERRQIELGYITGELKSLAKELDIPVIALSQLSRPEKNTKIRVPRLDDLRESGDIEQDADIVMFVHKPDYYDPSLTEWHNKGLIAIGKYRNGVRNNLIVFGHDERYKKIYNTDEIPEMKELIF